MQKSTVLELKEKPTMLEQMVSVLPIPYSGEVAAARVIGLELNDRITQDDPNDYRLIEDIGNRLLARRAPGYIFAIIGIGYALAEYVSSI